MGHLWSLGGRWILGRAQQGELGRGSPLFYFISPFYFSLIIIIIIIIISCCHVNMSTVAIIIII